MTAEFWLSDEPCRRSLLLAVNPAGFEREDDRRVLSGIVYILKVRCRWQDCPAVYGHDLQSLSTMGNSRHLVPTLRSPEATPGEGQLVVREEPRSP
jgi:hypothetical protein